MNVSTPPRQTGRILRGRVPKARMDWLADDVVSELVIDSANSLAEHATPPNNPNLPRQASIDVDEAARKLMLAIEGFDLEADDAAGDVPGNFDDDLTETEELSLRKSITRLSMRGFSLDEEISDHFIVEIPPNRKNEVQFGTLTVREYTQILSDTTANSGGIGLCIDWEYDEHPPVSLEDFESIRRGRRRDKQLVISHKKRERIASRILNGKRQAVIEALRQQARATVRQRRDNKETTNIIKSTANRMRLVLTRKVVC